MRDREVKVAPQRLPSQQLYLGFAITLVRPQSKEKGRLPIQRLPWYSQHYDQLCDDTAIHNSPTHLAARTVMLRSARRFKNALAASPLSLSADVRNKEEERRTTTKKGAIYRFNKRKGSSVIQEGSCCQIQTPRLEWRLFGRCMPRRNRQSSRPR